jgi:hypothetical protein
MPYTIQEGTLPNPAFNYKAGLDRSLNVIHIELKNIGPAQIVISRDQLQGAETLAQSVQRQLSTLERQVKRFVKHREGTLTIGPKAWPAIAVYTEFTQNKLTAFQAQVAAQTDASNVLVFTLSTSAALDKETLQQWLDCVAQFKAS